MAITSKSELIEYIKQQLGEPVIRLNIADVQYENRIQQAVDLFHDYHRNGSENVYVAHPITSTEISQKYFETPPGINSIVRVISYDANKSKVTEPNGSRDILTLSGSSFNRTPGFRGMGPAGGFGDEGASRVYIYLMDQYRADTEFTYANEDNYRWNKHTRRLYIDTNFDKFKEGTYIMYEAYMNMMDIVGDDPSTVWGEPWLKDYATACVKYQWGSNLTKFGGGALFGANPTLNGEFIYNEAKEEMQKLEQDVMEKWGFPPPILIG